MEVILEVIDVDDDEQSDSFDFVDEEAGVIGLGVSLAISLGVVGFVGLCVSIGVVGLLRLCVSLRVAILEAQVIPGYVLFIPGLCSQKIAPHYAQIYARIIATSLAV